MKTILLSPAEEIELIRLVQEKDSSYAKRKLVEANQGLVHKVVNRFPIKNASCSYDDLYQEGMIGLMYGISKFDSTRGYRLSTYVYNWIQAYVRRYFQNHGRTVRVPVHMSDKQLTLNKQIEYLTSELGRTPTLDEVRALNDDADSIMSHMTSNISLNASVDEDNELECFVGEDRTDEFEASVDADILLNKLSLEISSRDYQMLRMRYGLDTGIPQTLQETADRFGVTRARIHQVEKACISKMRELV
jgi:RNA polymerase primary sigma factor